MSGFAKSKCADFRSASASAYCGRRPPAVVGLEASSTSAVTLRTGIGDRSCAPALRQGTEKKRARTVHGGKHPSVGYCSATSSTFRENSASAVQVWCNHAPSWAGLENARPPLLRPRTRSTIQSASAMSRVVSMSHRVPHDQASAHDELLNVGHGQARWVIRHRGLAVAMV